MRKKTLIGLAALLFAALGFAGYYVYATRFAAAAKPAAAGALQTAVVQRGDLVIMASGTGSIVPARQISLGFSEGGTLIELAVLEGDSVTAGQVIARLQTQDSDETLAAQVAEAELEVIKAENALKALYTNAEVARAQALSDIATYSQAVRDAQYTLENYTMPTFLQGLEAVEALQKMRAALEQAVQEFEPYKYLSEYNALREQKLEVLNLAQANYDAAVKRLNYEYALQVAQANLTHAQQEYQKYQQGPAADELAEAQANLANLKARLALAKAEKSVLELVAPFDATVLAVDASLGETISAGAFLTLADLNPPTLEVYLDETDLDKAAVGFPAEVVFEALPDQTFNGRVIAVSQSLQSISDVKAVKVLVQLDLGNSAGHIFLPVGLSAAVDLIAGRATNAVLAPVEALRELDPGEYAVFVVENGQPILRLVEVGLIDLTYAEIKSGLVPGEIVSTGASQ